MIKPKPRVWTPITDRGSPQRNITTFVTMDVFEKFDELAQKIGLNKSALTRKLIEDYVANVTGK